MVVVRERKIMEASACNSRNGWRSNPLTTTCYGRVDSVDDIWVNRMPVIVPCYNGKSLQIHEELVVNGLSAISIRHHRGNCSEVIPEASLLEVSRVQSKADEEKEKDVKESKSRASKLSEASMDSVKKRSTTGLPICLGERMKRRNSFWNMHRPELSKLTWPQNFISSAMLQDFFHHHLRTHGTFCEPLHVGSDRTEALDEEIRDYTILRELVPPTVLPPDEKAVNIMEKSRSVQLNDEDLDPEIMVHKSRAEFCVTIGEYVRKPLLKRSTSHHVTKGAGSRMGSLTSQRDGFVSKEEVNAEEVVSFVVGSQAGSHPTDEKGTAVSGQTKATVEQSHVSQQSQAEGEGTSTDQVTEDSGDPARLRTILSPRDDVNEAK